MERYEDWADVIEALDRVANLSGQSQDFIIHLIEDPPTFLSPKQVAWIKDLQERHLV